MHYYLYSLMLLLERLPKDLCFLLLSEGRDSNPRSFLCTRFLATLCYHNQTKLVKPLRLLLGQHFTHLTLFQKPSEILQIAFYTPLYLRVVDQYRNFVCCSLEYIITILKFLQVQYLSFTLLVQAESCIYLIK